MKNKNQKELFLSISSYLTGFSETDLLGTGMLDTYYTTLLENTVEEGLSNFFEKVNQIFDESGDNEEKINADISSFLFAKDLSDLTKAIITMWYTGNWGQDVITSESYIQGLIWDAIEAHPPGAKQPGFGSWADKPVEIPTV